MRSRSRPVPPPAELPLPEAPPGYHWADIRPWRIGHLLACTECGTAVTDPEAHTAFHHPPVGP